MKYFIPVVLTVSIILLAQCKATRKATATQPAYELWINDFTNKKVVLDRTLYNSTTDVLSIDSVYINKDTLHILTNPLQACDADNFSLMWNGMMMKSLPPQTTVRLLLSNDPGCKEQHRFHLTYNISPLRMKQDSGANKSTIVHIGGVKPSVKYEF